MPERPQPLSLRLLSLYPKKSGSLAVGALARPRDRALAFGGLSSDGSRRRSERTSTRPTGPLEEYTSVLDFFTRRLKPGLRPQAPAVPGGINSPVDGALIAVRAA